MIFSFLFVQCNYTINSAKSPNNQSDSILLYKFVQIDSATHSYRVLNLYKDKMYFYSDSSAFYTILSSGQWKLNNGVLHLSSSLQKDSLPVSIDEEVVKDQTDNIVFDLVTNSTGAIVKGAALIVNDSAKTKCYPALNNCNFPRGTVKSIKVLIEGRCASLNYMLKNSRANKLVIHVLTQYDIEESYEFLDDKQYSFTGERIVSSGTTNDRMPRTMSKAME